ncbi:hypothetical protein F5H01DRAFT_349285 [Linnemannia elongata]|nr:hypothetical protein F5H01DRAFT_349285 [Linnemannia elongata]
MSTSKTNLVITIGSNIEAIFTKPYCCVCGVNQSTKRNLRRHIQGTEDRHPCESIESILRFEFQRTSTIKEKHFSARMLSDSIMSPVISSPLVASSTSASSTLSASSDSSATPTPITFSASSASSALAVSSDSSATPALSTPPGNTHNQYQSIISRLENLPTQDQMEAILSRMSRLENLSMPDQIQSLVSMIGRLEETVMGLRNDISRSSEWTERTIGIHERRQPRQASPYSSNTVLTPSPQRRQHRLSGSVSPTASQHSIMSFNGVTTSTPREEEHR